MLKWIILYVVLSSPLILFAWAMAHVQKEKYD